MTPTVVFFLHVKDGDSVGSVNDMIGYRLDGRALTPGNNFLFAPDRPPVALL
jgi:hypothetical protein